MGIEFDYRSTLGLLVLRVTDTPTEQELNASQDKSRSLSGITQMSAMLLDLRDQAGSILTGQKARNLLVQCDRHIRASHPESGDLPCAIVALPGTIGQGIGRMFMGHAYGLEHLRLMQFDDLDKASEWLELPPDWQDRIEAG